MTDRIHLPSHSGTAPISSNSSVRSEPAPEAPGKEVCLYEERPRNVYWETTIACSLACLHCRAEAINARSSAELDEAEARSLIDSVAELGSMLILTGGDPMERPDLFDLIDYARSKHVPVGVTPSTTFRLQEEHLKKLSEHGVAALGVSLDGAEAATHDAFRGFPGTFERAREVLTWAAKYELPVQVNTTVTGNNIHELVALHELLSEHHAPPVKRWALFFLVPTGRAQMTDLPDADEMEKLYGWLYDVGKKSPFHVGTIEAPMYRRYLIQRKLAEGVPMQQLLRQAKRNGFGIRDGNGVIFVSHKGEVLPSGFVPLTPLGNVRQVPLHEIYRNHPDLALLRDMDQLGGKCGRCKFRWVCGGSRARAAAVEGHMMAQEPLCSYDPDEHVDADAPS